MTAAKRPAPVGLLEQFNDLAPKIHAGICLKSGMHASPGGEGWLQGNFDILLENVFNKCAAFQLLAPLSQEHTVAKGKCSQWIKQKMRNLNKRFQTQCVSPANCRQDVLGEAELCTACAPKVTANITAMLQFDRFIAGNPQCTGLRVTTPEESNVLRARFPGPWQQAVDAVAGGPPGAFHPAVANQQPHTVAAAACGRVATHAPQVAADPAGAGVAVHAPPGGVRTAGTMQAPQVAADPADGGVAAHAPPGGVRTAGTIQPPQVAADPAGGGVAAHAPPGGVRTAGTIQPPQVAADPAGGGVAAHAPPGGVRTAGTMHAPQVAADPAGAGVAAHAPPGGVRTAGTIQPPQVAADVQDNFLADIGVWVKYLSECPWVTYDPAARIFSDDTNHMTQSQLPESHAIWVGEVCDALNLLRPFLTMVPVPPAQGRRPQGAHTTQPRTQESRPAQAPEQPTHLKINQAAAPAPGALPTPEEAVSPLPTIMTEAAFRSSLDEQSEEDEEVVAPQQAQEVRRSPRTSVTSPPSLEKQRAGNIARNIAMMRGVMEAKGALFTVGDTTPEAALALLQTVTDARLKDHLKALKGTGKKVSLTMKGSLFTLQQPATFAGYAALSKKSLDALNTPLTNELRRRVNSNPELRALVPVATPKSTAAEPRKSKRNEGPPAAGSNKRKKQACPADARQVTVSGATMAELLPISRKGAFHRAVSGGVEWLVAAGKAEKLTQSAVKILSGRMKTQLWETTTYGEEYSVEHASGTWSGAIGKTVHRITVEEWSEVHDYYCTAVASDNGANLQVKLPAVLLDFAIFHAEFDAHAFNSAIIPKFGECRVPDVHICEKGLLWRTSTGEEMCMSNLPKLLSMRDTVPPGLQVDGNAEPRPAGEWGTPPAGSSHAWVVTCRCLQ
ncbi:hypothetical protein CYMTET_18603 [Cymbomonas tetramitiformis]|uniref:Uncharacterized protein n=1 Tax=Cymbomonas tetramitiformis TaxID=36881 RepID=A0AAE0G7T3_9CHLO|nr:hypothetical protein CYMTET_18603 [Cymbomonas tetramitiformis]